MDKIVKRWRAEKGEKYYYIDADGIIKEFCEGVEENRNNFCYKTNNYFRTEEEAKDYLEKLNIYFDLKNIANYLNKGEEIDWRNYDKEKWSLFYDWDTKSFGLRGDFFEHGVGDIYCYDRNFFEYAFQRIGTENLIKLYGGANIDEINKTMSIYGGINNG